MRALFAMAAAGVVLAGCRSDDPADAHRAAHTWITNEGTFAMDHVSNHRVDVSEAVRRTYRDEVYYFQTEENARKFDDNPDVYRYEDGNRGLPPRPGTQGARDD